jgi:23S rRNA pseudouridine1911/1915/1917 synthase
MYHDVSVEFCSLVAAGQPVRLDVYLHQVLPGFTRSRLQKLIEDGCVLVAGHAGKPSLKILGRELLHIDFPAAIDDYVEPQDIELEIIYEDDDLIVVNKPVGMVTHPAAGNREGTLVNALLHHCRGSLSGIGGVLRPGIVHRLDKDTSGLLVVAKNDAAHNSLATQIKNRSAHRRYLAVVEGVLAENDGTIDKPIGRASVQRKQMAIAASGKNAITHFVVLARSNKYSLVEATLETGRTHQIRVHMSSIGYPIVGDIVYNHKTTGSLAGRHKLGLAGHALHAYRLSFTHPQTGKLLEFESQLPDGLAQLVHSISPISPVSPVLTPHTNAND